MIPDDFKEYFILASVSDQERIISDLLSLSLNKRIRNNEEKIKSLEDRLNKIEQIQYISKSDWDSIIPDFHSMPRDFELMSQDLESMDLSDVQSLSRAYESMSQDIGSCIYDQTQEFESRLSELESIFDYEFLLDSASHISRLTDEFATKNELHSITEFFKTRIDNLDINTHRQQFLENYFPNY